MSGTWGKRTKKEWGKGETSGLTTNKLFQNRACEKFFTYPFYTCFRSQLRRLYDESTFLVKFSGQDHLVYARRKKSRLWEFFFGNWGNSQHERELIEIHSLTDPMVFRNSNPTQKNVSEALRAERGYSHFHGTEPDRIIMDDYDWPPPCELEECFGPFDDAPRNLTGIGELLALGFEPMDAEPLEEEELSFVRPHPMLASDYMDYKEGDENLYIVGGKYKLEKLRPVFKTVLFEEDEYSPEEKPFILGSILWISYLAEKSFDDLKPIEYVHRTNEPYPVLARNKAGTQLYIFRGESQFSIDRSHPVSLGIKG